MRLLNILAGHGRRSGTTVVCSLLAAAATLSGVATMIAPKAAEAASPRDLAPSSGALFGAYVQPHGGLLADVQDAVNGLESNLGRKLAIDQHFYPWAKAFPTWQEPWDFDNGRLPLVSWGGVASSQINSGSQDDWIRARADGVKALGEPILLRWFGEFDGAYWSTTVGTPSDFIAAWRRIHDIFAQEGATNVMWVWCPTAYGFHSGRAQTYYPGDTYVDWIGADAYNWSPLKPGGQSGGPWTAFAPKFVSFYTWADPIGKPLVVAETGSQEDPIDPGRKAQWIADMGASLETVYPDIKALVYFDAVGGSNQGGSFDWTVDSSGASLDAYRALAVDPYFGGAPDITPPTVPGDLAASVDPSAHVALSWDASTDNVAVSDYRVYRNGTKVARVTSPTFIDGGVALGQSYSYSVQAEDAAGNSSPPSQSVNVTVSVTVDTVSPSTPTGLMASANGPHEVRLSWQSSTDNVGVIGYDVFRDGSVIASTGSSAPAYVDDAVEPATSYAYRVRAVDAAGNKSAQSSQTSIITPQSLFSDGFEKGNLSLWTASSGMAVQTSVVRSGKDAARATSQGSHAADAFEQLPSSASTFYYKLAFDVCSQGPNSVYLGRLRTASGIGIIGLYIRGDGKLAVYDDITGGSLISAIKVGQGAWHTVEAHVAVAGTSSRLDVWLDGAKVGDLSATLNLGKTGVGQLQLGDNVLGRTYDVAFDDVQADTVFIP